MPFLLLRERERERERERTGFRAITWSKHYGNSLSLKRVFASLIKKDNKNISTKK
jgi:hypothetical protein